MARIASLLLVAVACLVALAIPVLAAEPETGAVSGAAPETAWTGSVAGEPSGAVIIGFLSAGSTGTYCEDDPFGACDTFRLNVVDPGTKLTVTATAEVADDYVALEVVDPDGNATLVYEEEPQATVAVEAPKAGEYVVNVLGSPGPPATEVAYSATATLEGAAAPPLTATATPTPTPEPEPSPSPEPSPAPPPPASPPAQPAPRSLAIHADRRRIAKAVHDGFRTRVVCRGGCATVRLRVFISSLDGVEAGGAVLRGAEGRHAARVTFRPSLRRRLARARRLAIAIEAVATDPDGQSRRALQRLTLRR